MIPSKGKRTLSKGQEYGFGEILANGAGQKTLKNSNNPYCSYLQTDYDALFTTFMQ